MCMYGSINVDNGTRNLVEIIHLLVSHGTTPVKKVWFIVQYSLLTIVWRSCVVCQETERKHC